jgi:Rod binding domain-containing protein
MINSIAGLTSPAAPPSHTPKVHQVAQQFESLLIGQLLKTSREAGGSGWLGTGDEDEAGQTGMEVAEQELAKMLASKGGFGISRMVEGAMK